MQRENKTWRRRADLAKSLHASGKKGAGIVRAGQPSTPSRGQWDKPKPSQPTYVYTRESPPWHTRLPPRALTHPFSSDFSANPAFVSCPAAGRPACQSASTWTTPRSRSQTSPATASAAKTSTGCSPPRPAAVAGTPRLCIKP